MRSLVIKSGAVPATVNGELTTVMPLDLPGPGRWWKAETREPGDLPSTSLARGPGTVQTGADNSVRSGILVILPGLQAGVMFVGNVGYPA